MPTFIYTAKSQSGEDKSGVLGATSKNELALKLRQEGYFLTSATLAGEEKVISRFQRKIWSLFSHVPLAEKMIFTRHLAVMIKAGLALDRGLEILAAQTQNSQFRRIITDIQESVRRGHTFSESLAKYPNVFSDLFVSMIKVGENSGNLEEILNQLAIQMSKDYELRSKVRGALIYPAVIILLMIAVGILMMTMVIPKIAASFEELHVELPWTTKIVIGVSRILSQNSILGLIIFITLLVFLKIALDTKTGKRIVDYSILKLPPFSTLSRKINSARFARNLSSLIAAGVPIINALQITAKTMSNSFFQESLNNTAVQIQRGEALSKILSQYLNLYPIIVVQMIEVGETSGSLTDVLKNLADFYEEEISNATKNLSSIIEPILMVIIGIVIGFFAISMIQPLYSLMGNI